MLFFLCNCSGHEQKSRPIKKRYNHMQSRRENQFIPHHYIFWNVHGFVLFTWGKWTFDQYLDLNPNTCGASCHEKRGQKKRRQPATLAFFFIWMISVLALHAQYFKNGQFNEILWSLLLIVNHSYKFFSLLIFHKSILTHWASNYIILLWICNLKIMSFQLIFCVYLNQLYLSRDLSNTKYSRITYTNMFK